jgi:hypothetical protein
MAKRARDLTKACEQYLTAKGFFCWRGGCLSRPIGNHWAKVGTAGAPDLFAVKQIRTSLVFKYTGNDAANHVCLLGIEIKVGRDVVSPAQKSFHEGFEKHGGRVIVVRDIDDLVRAGI